MARPDRYTYEVVRRDEVTEAEFLAGLDKIGFEMAKNYKFLPKNYRIQAKDQEASMDVDSCLAKLVEWELVTDDPAWGEEPVARGTAVVHRSFLQLPIDARGDKQRDPGSPVAPSSMLAHTEKYGRSWAVQIAGAVDQTVFPFSRIQDIRDAEEVFEFTGHLTGTGVDYYIVDTGVDPDHPEFFEGPYGYRSYFAADGDDVYDVGEDDNNHGTGMSTSGAGRTTGLAIHSRVIWAKGLNGNNVGSTAALNSALNAVVGDFVSRAADGRPGVLNLSWSVTGSNLVLAAINAALDAGMILVAAAGNDADSGLRYPAGYADVISVGAMDLLRNAADFSNHGSGIDVWGPGIDVLQGWRGGSLGWGGGTSAASGFVTGAICCLLQGYKRPANRTAVQAVVAHIRDNLFHPSGIQIVNVNQEKSGTTTKIVKYPRGPQSAQARIPSLLNLCAQKRHMLGGSSFSRSVTRLEGIGPATQAAVHPTISSVIEPVHIGYGTPTSGSFSTYETMRPWLCRNHDVVDVDDVTVNRNVLPSIDGLGFNDGDGNPMQVPNPAAPDRAFMGGFSAAGEMYQTIPLDMTPSSNPVHFFDIFSNLDWDTGDITGWTKTGSGTLEVLKVRGTLHSPTGAYFIEGNAAADSTLTQVATLPASISTEKIDAGKMKVWLEATFGRSATVASLPNDAARMRLIAVDGSDADISTIFDSGVLNAGTGPGLAWDVHTPGGAFYLPTGTRKLKLVLDLVYFAGTQLNGGIGSLMGWVYEDTSEGERILEAVAAGKAQLVHSYIRRSLNDNTDDQGLARFNFRSATNGSISTEDDGLKSPHNWTQDWLRRIVPQNAAAVRLTMRYNRRAGTAINYHHMFHEMWVQIGRNARKLASKAGSVTRGGTVEAHSTGFDPASGTIYRP